MRSKSKLIESNAADVQTGGRYLNIVREERESGGDLVISIGRERNRAYLAAKNEKSLFDRMDRNSKFCSDNSLLKRKKDGIVAFMEATKDAMNSLMNEGGDSNFALSGRRFDEALHQYRKLPNHWSSINPRKAISQTPDAWGRAKHPMGDLMDEMCPTMIFNRSRSCSPEKTKTRRKILENKTQKVMKVLPIHRNEPEKAKGKVRELTIFYESNPNQDLPITTLKSGKPPSTSFYDDKNPQGCKYISISQKNLTTATKAVHFEPDVLLFSATLEGELELVMDSLKKVQDCDISKDDGLTILHTAICAQRNEIAQFLISYGCNVNAMDGDGWTPLHCAAICNNAGMVKLLIEAGAAPFTFTNDVEPEIPVDKCSEEENGYEECRTLLLEYMDSLGTINGGNVYATYDYESENDDEISFKAGQRMKIVETKKDLWWWIAKIGNNYGLVPKNFLSIYPPRTAKK